MKKIKKIKKLFRCIKSIGIEVECGCNTDIFEIQNIKNCSIGNDGSVFVDFCYHHDLEIRYHGSIYEVKKFIKEIWTKYKIRQNETCGNHVHVRLDSKILGAFTYINFVTFFLSCYRQKYQQNEKYLNREQNRYSYSRITEEILLKQLANYSDYRYRAINLKSLNEQGTIEIRIMPYCQDWKEHIKQITFIVKTIILYLLQLQEVAEKEIQIEKQQPEEIQMKIYKISSF